MDMTLVPAAGPKTTALPPVLAGNPCAGVKPVYCWLTRLYVTVTAGVRATMVLPAGLLVLWRNVTNWSVTTGPLPVGPLLATVPLGTVSSAAWAKAADAHSEASRKTGSVAARNPDLDGKRSPLCCVRAVEASTAST